MLVEALSTNMTTYTSYVLTVNFNPNYIFSNTTGMKHLQIILLFSGGYHFMY
jgi:hypothetical protein